MSDLSLVPLTIASAIGLSVALVVAGIAVMRSPVAVARGRVRALIASDSPYADALDASVRRGAGRRFGGFTEGLGRSASHSVQLTLHRSGLPLRVGEYVAIRLAAIAVGGLGLGFLGILTIGDAAGIAFALAGTAVGFAVPPLALNIAARRRAQAIEGQLVELCELMSSMLRGGYGYVQALSTSAEELGAPLGHELTRLVDSVRLGADVDEELADLNERLDSADFEMLATAISIQRRSGGNLSEILSGVAETIRYRLSFKREVAALTAQARYSAVIVAGIPVILLAALSVMDPLRYQLLFTHPIGRVILALAVVMDVIGYVVIKRISKVEA